MLKLVYDSKCGFKDLYITEKNKEENLTFWMELINEHTREDIDAIKAIDPDFVFEPDTEEGLYEQYKDDPEALMKEVFDHVVDQIYEATVLEYAKTYFKHICYADPANPFVPGYFDMINFRLVLEDEPLKKAVVSRDAPLKASEVMALLNISRPTLCHYVKKGLITVDSNYTGKQYRYNKDSVLALLNK